MNEMRPPRAKARKHDISAITCRYDRLALVLQECSKSAVVNIVHLIYQHKNYEGHARDYEFSGTSMREHWDSGYEDTLRTLRHPEWLERSAISRGVTVHDLHREDPT